MTHIGYLLRNFRFKNKITCKVIALGLGDTNTNKGARRYLEWERGEGYPKKEELEKLFQVMRLDPQKVEEVVKQDQQDYEKWLDEPIPMTLVVRLMACVDVDVPENLSPDEVIEFAREYARKANLRVCLVKSRRGSVYFDKNGDVEFTIRESLHMMMGRRRFGFRLSQNSETITPCSVSPNHPLSKR